MRKGPRVTIGKEAWPAARSANGAAMEFARTAEIPSLDNRSGTQRAKHSNTAESDRIRPGEERLEVQHPRPARETRAGNLAADMVS